MALSSTEAEFIAASEYCKELLYLKTVIQELTTKKIVAEMYIDNQSSIKLLKSGVFNKRLKHIDVRYHFIHEKVEKNLINLYDIKSEAQTADIFTKPLGKIKFDFHKEKLVKYVKIIFKNICLKYSIFSLKLIMIVNCVTAKESCCLT